MLGGGGGGNKIDSELQIVFLVRERERVLSRFTGDPIVEIRRDKKQSCSTHRDLYVGTGFRSFRQTP